MNGELIFGQFLAFGKHIKAPHVDIMEVWSLIESMAFFLNSDIEAWYREYSMFCIKKTRKH